MHDRGHGQWCGDCLREWRYWVEGGKGVKTGTTIIEQSIKYNNLKKEFKSYKNNCRDKMKEEKPHMVSQSLEKK